ncbi:hypothetical protein G9A89_007691, partial [Geosiphon pyriformis]
VEILIYKQEEHFKIQAGTEINSLILVDEYWQTDFLRDHESLFKRISDVLAHNQFPIWRIYFVGHSTGGGGGGGT